MEISSSVFSFLKKLPADFDNLMIQTTFTPKNRLSRYKQTKE